MDSKELEKLSERQRTAMYIAAVVRDSMEDFHVAHLSDAQMKELNQIIRDGIYTALEAMGRAVEEDERGNLFLREMVRGIPPYWEPPKLNFLFPDKKVP